MSMADAAYGEVAMGLELVVRTTNSVERDAGKPGWCASVAGVVTVYGKNPREVGEELRRWMVERGRPKRSGA